MISITTIGVRCTKCNKSATKDGHDPCIANLHGVINACCGHGHDQGYVMFENGITIRGVFDHVESSKGLIDKKNGKITIMHENIGIVRTPKEWVELALKAQGIKN